MLLIKYEKKYVWTRLSVYYNSIKFHNKMKIVQVVRLSDFVKCTGLLGENPDSLASIIKSVSLVERCQKFLRFHTNLRV